MDGMDRLDAFHFYDNHVLDDQIDAVAKFDLLSVENHRQPDLAGHLKATLSDFMGETALVGAFQQARPEHRVDVHGRRNDCPRNLIDAKRSKRRSRSAHPNCITHEAGFTL